MFFDDKPALTANELVQIDGTVFDEWRTAAFSSNSGLLRRPISMLSFAANHAVSGDFSPLGVKAVNLVIHLGIGSLLYFLFLAILAGLQLETGVNIRRLLALTAAGISLLHPLNVSTRAVRCTANGSTVRTVCRGRTVSFYALPPALGTGGSGCWRRARCRPVAGIACRPGSAVKGERGIITLVDCGAGGLHFSWRLGRSAKQAFAIHWLATAAAADWAGNVYPGAESRQSHRRLRKA